jgi:CBS-domain-containing membrane protein
MSRDVNAVGAHEPLLKAAQLMCAKHLHRLPVTGEGRRVVGMVSTMDIVAAVLNALDEAEAAQFCAVAADRMEYDSGT